MEGHRKLAFTQITKHYEKDVTTEKHRLLLKYLATNDSKLML